MVVGWLGWLISQRKRKEGQVAVPQHLTPDQHSLGRGSGAPTRRNNPAMRIRHKPGNPSHTSQSPTDALRLSPAPSGLAPKKLVEAGSHTIKLKKVSSLGSGISQESLRQRHSQRVPHATHQRRDPCERSASRVAPTAPELVCQWTPDCRCSRGTAAERGTWGTH